ncbi:MAG: helix-turn-helix transcriptional regulator [Armatimonadetes bacterium]|nr:helix-turn-helix transcriptional regulator [Armatimonadota bacterium]
MDSKSKEAVKTKDVLKQLQSELRQLQATVNALQRTDAPATAEDDPAAHKEKGDKAEWAVQYAVHHRPAGGEGVLKTGVQSFIEAQLMRVTDDAAATLGYALSSPQKVALLRALLARPAESAAALGETAALSTGSLYHHLHDLMHAGLIGQSARNRYVLTDRGRRVLLVLLALAAQS